MPATGVLTLGAGTATFDMNGFMQTIGGLAGAGGIVNLGAGALIIDQSGSTTFSGDITGSGSLTKAGSGTLTLGGTSTYTGDTAVINGTLVLADSGALSGATNIIVSAGAAMTLQRVGNGSLNDQSIIRVVAGGKVNLADGVNENVKQLFLGSGNTVAGTWGSFESSAKHRTDEYFTGSGMMTVEEYDGTLLIVR